MTDSIYGLVDSKLTEGLNEQQKSAVLNWEAYSQFQTAMAEIIQNMKEIPILPSEIPPEGDKHSLTKVELPPEGGVLSFMEHFEHPYRGFPYLEFVDKTDIIKKLVKGSLSGIYHSFRAKWIKILFILPAILVFRELIWTGIYTFYRLIERYRIKPLRYSKAIRALHEAFSVPRGDSFKEMELRYMIRDILCMILEFDNAYRFRAQDILAELNQKALKNPIKELHRIIDIASIREKTQMTKDTWKLIKMFVSFYLRFDRKFKNLVVHVLKNLNLEEFKLTAEDIAFCDPRKDYTFGYKNNVVNKSL